MGVKEKIQELFELCDHPVGQPWTKEDRVKLYQLAQSINEQTIIKDRDLDVANNQWRKYERKLKDDERQFWKDLVLAYTNATNSTSSDSAIRWADNVVETLRTRS